MSLLPGARLGPYQIVGPIGAGGMGEVYRARDTNLAREVAVKVLGGTFIQDPDRLMRFEREAQTLASLNHPHIAQIYGLEQVSAPDGLPGRAIVMELVEGEDLAERLTRGAIPVDEALAIGMQVAAALEAAHGARIVHRDLKPANVRLRPDGVAKVLDFGLAKPAGGDTPATTTATVTSPAVTMTGVVLGTAAYMSPEQAKGRPVDKRADIWAFGVVLYEMLSGRPAFAGDSITETITAVLRDTPDWSALPSGTPESVRRLLRRCLQRDPNERLHDMGDARLELAASDPDEEAPRAVARSRRVHVAAWVGIGAALGAIAAGWLLRTEGAAPGTVASLGLTLPSDVPLRIDDMAQDLAITSDGARIVYSSARSDPEGARIAAAQLVTRDLRGFEATPLASLGLNARMPFTSPDGRWIGLETTISAKASPVLAKVPSDGGPLVVVCELAGLGPLRGASWTSDDRILFATSHTATGLFLVSAAGGTPQQLTTPDRERGERDHLWPDVLPDNSATTFTVALGGERFGIAVMRTGESTWRVVIPDGSAARYLSSGHLVYVSHGILYGVGFDSRTLAVTTEPVALINGVMTKASGAGGFAVSPAGTLVYVPGADRERLRRLVWLQPDGTTTALPLPARGYRSARLSPDGRRIAVLIEERGTTSLWIYDTTRESFTRVTEREESVHSPLWSPDGRQVAFWSEAQKGIFTIDVDGGNRSVRLASAETGSFFPTAWTADGTHIAFVRESPNLDLLSVAIRPPHVVKPVVQTSGANVEASFSPDGRWMTHISFDGSVPEVTVGPAGHGERRWPIAPSGRHPRWSADSRHVLFMEGGAIYRVRIDAETGQAVGSPVKVLDIPAKMPDIRPIEMTPDGKRFLMLERVEGSDKPADVRIVLNWIEDLRVRMQGAARPPGSGAGGQQPD